MKALLLVLMFCASPLMAGNIQDLQDDIDDLRSQIWTNEMYRILDQMNKQSLSNNQSSPGRKYPNGVCRLLWVNGTGLVEIAKEVKGYTIYELAIERRQGIFAELYVDKSISRKGVEALMQINKDQIYRMCK